MGLLNDLKAAVETKPLGKVENILAHLNDEEKSTLATYVEMVREQRSLPTHERSCTAAALLKILNDNGYRIGKTALQDYINKGDSQ